MELQIHSVVDDIARCWDALQEKLTRKSSTSTSLAHPHSAGIYIPENLVIPSFMVKIMFDMIPTQDLGHPQEFSFRLWFQISSTICAITSFVAIGIVHLCILQSGFDFLKEIGWDSPKINCNNSLQSLMAVNMTCSAISWYMNRSLLKLYVIQLFSTHLISMLKVWESLT